METMPDKVKHIGTKTQIEENDQAKIRNLFLEGNLFVHKIERDKQQDANAAVNIWPML